MKVPAVRWGNFPFSIASRWLHRFSSVELGENRCRISWEPSLRDSWRSKKVDVFNTIVLSRQFFVLFPISDRLGSSKHYNISIYSKSYPTLMRGETNVLGDVQEAPNKKPKGKHNGTGQSWGIFLGPLLTNEWETLKKGTWSGGC